MFALDIEPTRSAPRPAGGALSLGRHQLTALVATCMDFVAMTLCHELLGIDPVNATVLGATLGGYVSFELGRTWVFGVRDASVWSQALRYAAVSVGCVILNASGMALLDYWLSSSAYLMQRALVSLAAGVLWSYPAQRWLVFRREVKNLAQLT